ncbi:MAG: hypothetical protein L6Q34_08100 [Nitrospira sp.]|nr:hypothetical protein [Nitrospira sp.]MEB2337389.1 hypothetical protein [Nitrospirales bacterium]QOJ36549.1 MAG: hypothetical protein HRU82_17050 [Nitrospira sp.]
MPRGIEAALQTLLEATESFLQRLPGAMTSKEDRKQLLEAIAQTQRVLSHEPTRTKQRVRPSKAR